ncbi:MAG TPA: TetR/AcrR family transcriptional regulator [Solirubrobacterales bacterium]|nr:TetR/AcrR family transcriptional regulator [Solirubrobacterales bacterium]
MLTTGNDVLTVPDRERILQAMADCCAENGYAETTVDTVLKRAGVEPESFDSHFASKEDCALAALNKIVSETLARISMTNPDAEGAVERRKYEGRAVLELMAARPTFARLGFIESRQGGTEPMHSAYASGVRVLALMMERLGRSGGSGLAARAALGGAEAVIRRELAAGRAARLPQLLPDFVYAVLVPFVGQGEALRQAKLAAKVATEEG